MPGSGRRPARLALACALLCALAGPARGEGEGRRISVKPSLQVTTVADDNVFLEKKGEADVGAWVRPAVEISYRGRAVEAGVDLAADIRQYALHYSELDRYLFRIHAFAEAGILPGLTARLSNTFAPAPVELGLPEDEGSNLIQTNRTQLDLRYWRELGRSEFEVGLRGARFMGESFSAELSDGHGGVVEDDSFHPDYWELLAFGELQRDLGRRASVFARTQGRLRTFDDSSEAGFQDVSVLLGVRSELLRKLAVEVSGGYGLVATNADGSKSRILGEARARYEFPHGWVAQLSASRKFAADVQGNDFTQTGGRLTVQKNFGTRTSASLAAFLAHYDSESWSDGSDLWGGLSLTLRRQLTRRTQAAVVYRYWQNAGDRTNDDFEQNQIRLVFTYRR